MEAQDFQVNQLILLHLCQGTTFSQEEHNFAIADLLRSGG